MAYNGHQRDDESTEDETPTKQPRPDAPEVPNNEASASAGRAASDRPTSNSTPRQRIDSVKKTRPRFPGLGWTSEALW